MAGVCRVSSPMMHALDDFTSPRRECGGGGVVMNNSRVAAVAAASQKERTGMLYSDFSFVGRAPDTATTLVKKSPSLRMARETSRKKITSSTYHHHHHHHGSQQLAGSSSSSSSKQHHGEGGGGGGGGALQESLSVVRDHLDNRSRNLNHDVTTSWNNTTRKAATARVISSSSSFHDRSSSDFGSIPMSPLPPPTTTTTTTAPQQQKEYSTLQDTSNASGRRIVPSVPGSPDMNLDEIYLSPISSKSRLSTPEQQRTIMRNYTRSNSFHDSLAYRSPVKKTRSMGGGRGGGGVENVSANANAANVNANVNVNAAPVQRKKSLSARKEDEQPKLPSRKDQRQDDEPPVMGRYELSTKSKKVSRLSFRSLLARSLSFRDSFKKSRAKCGSSKRDNSSSTEKESVPEETSERPATSEEQQALDAVSSPTMDAANQSNVTTCSTPPSRPQLAREGSAGMSFRRSCKVRVDESRNIIHPTPWNYFIDEEVQAMLWWTKHDWNRRRADDKSLSAEDRQVQMYLIHCHTLYQQKQAPRPTPVTLVVDENWDIPNDRILRLIQTASTTGVQHGFRGLELWSPLIGKKRRERVRAVVIATVASSRVWGLENDEPLKCHAEMLTMHCRCMARWMGRADEMAVQKEREDENNDENHVVPSEHQQQQQQQQQ